MHTKNMMVLDNIQSRLLGRTIASDSEHNKDKEASHEVCDGGTVSVWCRLKLRRYFLKEEGMM